MLFPQLLVRDFDQVTAVNTTAETLLWSGTIAANILTPLTSIRMFVCGFYHQEGVASPGTLWFHWYIRLGGDTFWHDILDVEGSANSAPWQIDAEIIGDSLQQTLHGRISFGSNQNVPAVGSGTLWSPEIATPIASSEFPPMAVDTGLDQLLEVSVQMAGAYANSYVRKDYAAVYLQ